MKTIRIIKSLLHYVKTFLIEARKFPKNTEFFLLNSKTKHKIQFDPSKHMHYLKGAINLINFFIDSSKLKNVEFEKIIKGCEDLTESSCKVYQDVPTAVRRYNNHNKLVLSVVQKALKPINCSPSLHTGYTVYAFLVSKKFFPEKVKKYENEMNRTIETILFTKLHVIEDVSFGILASDIIYSKNFGEFEIDINIDKRIPKDYIEKLYLKMKRKYQKEKDLSKVMEKYYIKNGYKKIVM